MPNLKKEYKFQILKNLKRKIIGLVYLEKNKKKSVKRKICSQLEHIYELSKLTDIYSTTDIVTMIIKLLQYHKICVNVKYFTRSLNTTKRHSVKFGDFKETHN